MRTVPVLVVVTVASLAISVAALAQTKGSRAIQYRQGVYHAMGWNFGPMNAMVRGKIPWNQAEFAKRASRIAFYSQQLLEGFPPGSDTGAKTDAKPAIWQNFDDFKAKMQNFENAAATMAKVTQGNDQAASKQAFIDTAKACKACHEKYRNDD